MIRKSKGGMKRNERARKFSKKPHIDGNKRARKWWGRDMVIFPDSLIEYSEDI